MLIYLFTVVFGSALVFIPFGLWYEKTYENKKVISEWDFSQGCPCGNQISTGCSQSGCPLYVFETSGNALLRET